MGKNFLIDSIYNSKSWAALTCDDFESGDIPDELLELIEQMSKDSKDFFAQNRIYYVVDTVNKLESLIIHKSESKILHTEKFWSANQNQPIGSILLNFLFYFRKTFDSYAFDGATNFYDLPEFASLLSSIHCFAHNAENGINDTKDKDEALTYLIWSAFLQGNDMELINKIRRMVTYIDLCANKELDFTKTELARLSVVNNDEIPGTIPILVRKRKSKHEKSYKPPVISPIDIEMLREALKKQDICFSQAKHYRINSILDLFYASLFELIQAKRTFRKCKICGSFIVWERSYCKWKNPYLFTGEENKDSAINMTSCDSIRRSSLPVRTELRLLAQELKKECEDKLIMECDLNFDEIGDDSDNSIYGVFRSQDDKRLASIKNERSLYKRTLLVVEYISWIDKNYFNGNSVTLKKFLKKQRHPLSDNSKT